MHHYTDGGLQNVWLANGYTLRTTPFGDAITIHDTDGLTRAICLALSQPALGKMMGIDGQSVARWEKTGKVPKWADKSLRLLYVTQANGHEPICQAIERLRVVERLVKQRIVVQESAYGWQPTLQPLESSSEQASVD